MATLGLMEILVLFFGVISILLFVEKELLTFPPKVDKGYFLSP